MYGWNMILRDLLACPDTGSQSNLNTLEYPWVSMKDFSLSEYEIFVHEYIKGYLHWIPELKKKQIKFFFEKKFRYTKCNACVDSKCGVSRKIFRASWTQWCVRNVLVTLRKEDRTFYVTLNMNLRDRTTCLREEKIMRSLAGNSERSLTVTTLFHIVWKSVVKLFF